MLKYAVIGTGWITQSFIDGANLDGNMKLEGVCSRNEVNGRKFADMNGAQRIFTSPEELAESDIEAVYIASPNAFHSRQTEMMLKYGKHVICEKPITVTPEEFCYLQNIAEKNNLVYVEAIMYMFSPVRNLLKDAIEKIGIITSAHFDFSQLSSKYPLYKKGELPNIFNPEMATGCLEDLGIYCVYPAVDLFGTPDKINADSFFMKSGADGSGNASLLYNDKCVTLTYSKLGQSRGVSQIFGDKGTITIESVSKLTGIKTVFNNGSEQIISGDYEKAVLMGNEAAGFRQIIERREENSQFYNLLRERAIETQKTMARIRASAGIDFCYKPLV